MDDVISPFGYKRGEGIDAGFGEHDWICDRDRAKTDPLFESLNPVDGKITGAGKFDRMMPFPNRFSIYFHQNVIQFPQYSRQIRIDKIEITELGVEQNLEIVRR